MSAPVQWRFGQDLEPLRAAVAAGHPIAIPTESSYGLAVDPRSEAGVRKIYDLKRRERGKPLPVVASGIGQIEALGGRLDEPSLVRLAARWPAALSLLVPIDRPLPAAAGTGRLAVRVPEHDGLRALLSDLGTALTATSANRSGESPLTDPQEVAELLALWPGSIVIDDGVLPGGQPSTLISVRSGVVELLRPGRIGSEEIERLLAGGGFSADSVEILADESR